MRTCVLVFVRYLSLSCVRVFLRAFVCAGERAFECAPACVRALDCEFACAFARVSVHICAFSCVGLCVCA